eukprot:1237651-Prymnesium_polylepis.1
MALSSFRVSSHPLMSLASVAIVVSDHTSASAYVAAGRSPSGRMKLEGTSVIAHSTGMRTRLLSQSTTASFGRGARGSVFPCPRRLRSESLGLSR